MAIVDQSGSFPWRTGAPFHPQVFPTLSPLRASTRDGNLNNRPPAFPEIYRLAPNLHLVVGPLEEMPATSASEQAAQGNIPDLPTSITNEAQDFPTSLVSQSEDFGDPSFDTTIDASSFLEWASSSSQDVPLQLSISPQSSNPLNHQGPIRTQTMLDNDMHAPDSMGTDNMYEDPEAIGEGGSRPPQTPQL